MTFDENATTPLTAAELQAFRVSLLEEMAERSTAFLKYRQRFRCKPLIGGQFGAGRYCIASMSTVWNGLDRVQYYVLEESAWLLIGFGDSVPEAMSVARRILRTVDSGAMQHFLAALAARRRREVDAMEERERSERADMVAAKRAVVTSIDKNIPKRRRRIFDESGGKCHYCETPLTLDGRWHIEHKMPRALLGTNEPSNLVAACAPCNHKKRDRTDQEFIAQRAAGATT